MLTIAIPTYNRNEKLVRSVDLLIPQLTDQIKILIFDNCSTVPVADSLGDRLKHNIEVVRNKYNVGMSANIIRCFEHCDTEWLWLLGDDDPPLGNAVSTIQQEIQNYPTFGFFNFKSDRPAAIITKGINEFISKIDHFGNLLYIAQGIYNLKQLQIDFRLAYQLSYSLAPHMVLLLSGIKADTQVALLEKELIDVSKYDTTAEESWSWLTLSLIIPILYEVPLAIGAHEKERFAQLIKSHIKPPSAVYSLLMQPRYNSLPTYEKRFLLRQIFFRSLLFRAKSRYILSFLWNDFKLFVKGKRSNQNVQVSAARDERI